jgi:diguanylate cyclase (GGDEF)-like protein
MPGGADFMDVGMASRRLRARVLLALSLCAALPVTALLYVVYRHVVPSIDPSDSATFLGLQTLILMTILGTIGGSWMVWNMGRTVTALAELMAREPGVARLPPRTDDASAVVGNFSKMFETIEQQANEINSFATRLDAAYKELESTNARLKETSFKDDVTGLYNRRFFTIRLEEEISRYRRFNHPVSMVLLDLDGFKAVNDELGHTVGDETLRDVAQILMKHSRGINVVSRYGGDEFAILLVETSKAGARLYGERIREVISRFHFAHGKPLTASLGISSLPDDGAASAEELFKMADEALYAAKRSGKNQVATLETRTERHS